MTWTAFFLGLIGGLTAAVATAVVLPISVFLILRHRARNALDRTP